MPQFPNQLIVGYNGSADYDIWCSGKGSLHLQHPWPQNQSLFFTNHLTSTIENIVVVFQKYFLTI